MSEMIGRKGRCAARPRLSPRISPGSPAAGGAAVGGMFALLLLAAPAAGQRPIAGGAPPPGFRDGAGGPGTGTEVEIRSQFDANGDKVLDAAERLLAREWLSSRAGPGGPGGGMPGGGRAGFRSVVTPTPGLRVSPEDVRTYPGASLYDPKTLRTLFLEFENPDWEPELAAFYNTDVDVPALLTVDGTVYRDVGVGFRGASSFRMVPEGSKRPLNLSIDFVDGEQRLAGYRTLNLLNAMNDPTFVRGVLYSQIARSYLPAPQINFVRVVINGEDWGIYLNAQQFNKDFLADFFSSTEGARWKAPGSPNGRAGMEYLGEDPAPYRRLYEIKSKDDPASWAALINLFRVLNETPVDQLEAALEPILDVDGTLRFLAVEMALVNSDGYWTRASDYNLYMDEAGRFHIIPHDMNEALGVSGNVNLDPLIGLNDPGKPLRSKLLAVPALRDRYLEYVKDVATTWLDWNRIEPLVREYQSLIAEQVAADRKKLYSTTAFTAEVESLRDFATRRREFLLR